MKKICLALALVTYGFMVEAAAQRSYVSGYFSLVLDGVQAGALNGAEGGAVSAEVVETRLAGAQAAEKHLGTPRYENFDVLAGFAGMDASMYQWIAQSWNQPAIRKNGAIVAADYRMEARGRTEFFNARIVETAFPACDAAGKDASFIKVSFAPEFTRSARASGRVAANVGRDAQKRWLPANFRLTIDGLDCTRIARIESFSVKRTEPRAQVGEDRDYLNEPGKIEFPNLKITFSAASAQTWQDWFQDFVLAGNNLSGNEKHGTLEFLSPNRQEVLATVEFNGLGIFRLASAQGGGEAAERLTADLYCEKMAFIPGNTVR